jgi:hypothetical protein
MKRLQYRCGNFGFDIAKLQFQGAIYGHRPPQAMILDAAFRNRARDRMARHHERK